ncbi:MAG: ribose transport system substrate-binding protein [Propionibacteriaceae bacterium]|nr:ribose transport system substrate-binding protein [Propionibacteriaceae bacterium]
MVGFAQQQLQAPYFAASEVQSEEIAREQGFKLLFQAANKDPVIQMNQMQAMIPQAADVLVVHATSVKDQKQMMTHIASQIPVTYIDTSVPRHRYDQRAVRRPRRTQPTPRLPRRTEGRRHTVRDQGRAVRGLPAGQGPSRRGNMLAANPDINLILA